MKILGLLGVAVSGIEQVYAQSNEQFVFDGSSYNYQATDSQPINIAVIGAGAGGASTAYHLRQFAESSGLPINITVFERNSYIGGRSTTVNVYDKPNYPVELGASIFVEVNRILTQAVKDFELSTSAPSFVSDEDEANNDIPGAVLSVWDGREFVLVQEGRGSGWWDYAKLFWRYGLAPLKTMRLMKSTVNKFLSMYDEPHFPFASLTQVAQDVGLLAVTAATGEQFLTENEITGEFGREVVQASTRVNYAQNLRHIHGLEAMVCMAAENAMAVQGGNWQIFEAMVNASEAATLLDTKVTALEKQTDGSYVVKSETNVYEQPAVVQSQRFDTVVLAAPYQFADIVTSPKPEDGPDDIPYVELHVTLFTSPWLISPSFFNLPADKPAPRAILTTLPKDEDPKSGRKSQGSHDFFSISTIRAVINPETQQKEYVYKIFSAAPPTSRFLCNLMGKPCPENDELSSPESLISWIERKIWHSYPYEYPRVTFESTRLDERLWYTSGIESFISTMETSALMGKNVARLVIDDAKQLRARAVLMEERSHMSNTLSSGELPLAAAGVLPT